MPEPVREIDHSLIQPALARSTSLGTILGFLVFITIIIGTYWKYPFKITSARKPTEVQVDSGIAQQPITVSNEGDKVVEPLVEAIDQTLQEVPAVVVPTDEDPNSVGNVSRPAPATGNAKQVSFADIDNKENEIPTNDEGVEARDAALAAGATTSTTEPVKPVVPPPTPDNKLKKPAHRGQRGGKREKERRKMRGELDQNDNLEDGIKPLGQKITVVAEGVVRADGAKNGTMQLVNLGIDLQKRLGAGSGGTVVFEGNFEGREVAVKRMLVEHYELALQEVSLLENSEDHPNVVRYFCRREDDHFLYIALELCQASLFDLFKDRRHNDLSALPDPKYMPLIEQIARSPVTAMRQLAEGLKHLHALRIVHRDIKPQNLLVAQPKKNSTSTFPRLVISDFGLCKTLPEGGSTVLGATINAGTTGWKAPELIHQPRDASLVTGSQNSVSNGSNPGGDPQPGIPGVKRSVDIFSLGCVFFYILTQGLHPFDDEEGWLAMRERNIKMNRCNLSAIEIHGQDTIDLIKWMLSPRPEERPTAAEVLAHPFFWNAEDRLEFLSLASDRFDQEPRDGTSALLDTLEARAEDIIPPGPSMTLAASSPPRGSANWTYAAHKRPPPSTLSTSPPPSIDDISFPALGSTPPPPPAPVALPPPEPNFLAALDKKFIDTLGKQRKYNGARLADLLRALRNKHHHWDDMPDDVKAKVGEVPEGYLRYWETRFPGLVVGVWRVVRGCEVREERRFGRWFAGRV